MKLFSGKVKELGIVSIVIIVGLSLGLFFYINSLTETNLRSNLFEQQQQRQIQSTYTVAKNIGSDLNLVVFMMEGLADSVDLQQGDFATPQAKDLLEEKYRQFSTLTNIHRLFLVDRNNIVLFSLAPTGYQTLLGDDLSQRDWVQGTRTTLEPVFTSGYENQGIYRIIITIPVIDRITNEYLGLIGTSIPTGPFFAQFRDLGYQSMVVLDKNGTVLEHGEKKSLEGQNFFSDVVQSYTNYDETLNNFTGRLLKGSAGYDTLDYGSGESLLVQSPVLVKGEPTLFIQTVTPASSVYSNLEEVLFSERVKTLTLLGGAYAAILVLIIMLVKWNTTLNKEVQRKTDELIESERMARELEYSNEAMKVYLEDVLKEVKGYKSSRDNYD
ncbi:MAG: cache domain-containing protein [Nitrososphaeraceae archaeon]